MHAARLLRLVDHVPDPLRRREGGRADTHIVALHPLSSSGNIELSIVASRKQRTIAPRAGLGYLTMSGSVIGHCIADILSKNVWGFMEFLLEHRVHVRSA